MLKKLLFLLVLFISSFVASDVFAVCNQVIFAYAPNSADTTAVVEVVRYFDGENWFESSTCPRDEAASTVEIPLQGTFASAIPVGFSFTKSAYSNVRNMVTGSQVVNAEIVCNRNIQDKLTCRLNPALSVNVFPGYYSTVVWTPSLLNSQHLTSFTVDDVGMFSARYVTASCARFDVVDQVNNTTNTFFYGRYSELYYADSICANFLGSFDVSATNMLPIGFAVGATTVMRYSPEQETVFRRGAIYCNYEQPVNTDGYIPTATCFFDYDQTFGGNFYLSAYLVPVGLRVGRARFYTDGINTVVSPILSCYKVDVYGLGLSGGVVTPVLEETIYNNGNGAWFSDATCKTKITTFNLNKTNGVPVVFSASESTLRVITVPVGTTVLSNQSTPIMCDYDLGAENAVCNAIQNVSGDTAFYPVSYVKIPANTIEVTSVKNDDGTVNVDIVNHCYNVTLNLTRRHTVSYSPLSRVWYGAANCSGSDVTKNGYTYTLGADENVPLSFVPVSDTATKETKTITDGQALTVVNNAPFYTSFNAYVNRTEVTIFFVGAVDESITYRPIADVPQSDFLVVRYDKSPNPPIAVAQNFYQIKINANDVMPETIFYHDGLKYYRSDFSGGYTKLPAIYLNDNYTKVPVGFVVYNPGTITERDTSFWRDGVTLWCDYDSNGREPGRLDCELVTKNKSNQSFYVAEYAKVDKRALKIYGGTNALAAYCNALSVTGLFNDQKTVYSRYYVDDANAFRVRWYSDAKCTTELNENIIDGVNYPFVLSLHEYNGVSAVPFFFNTTGHVFAPIEADGSFSNPGPIYCVYNAVNNTADCMFNVIYSNGSGMMPGGGLVAPDQPLTYTAGRAAKIVEGKVLTIKNNIVETGTGATTVIVYNDKTFCNIVRLTTPGAVLNYDYHTDGNYWYSIMDTNCERPVELVLPMLNGAVPIYFNSGDCVRDAIIYDETPESAFAYGASGVPCLYSGKNDVVNCEFDLKNMTNDINIFCVNNFVKKCISSQTALCELNVTKVDGFNSLKVDYINCCLAGYHDESGNSSATSGGQNVCSIE